MALYQAVLTIPPNTPEANPAQVILKPALGRLSRVTVYFRDGCLDAVAVRVLTSGGRQIAPLPGGQWLRDNNQHIEWIENIHLENASYTLICEGFSDAVDWPHTVDFRFEILK